MNNTSLNNSSYSKSLLVGDNNNNRAETPSSALAQSILSESALVSSLPINPERVVPAESSQPPAKTSPSSRPSDPALPSISPTSQGISPTNASCSPTSENNERAATSIPASSSPSPFSTGEETDTDSCYSMDSFDGFGSSNESSFNLIADGILQNGSYLPPSATTSTASATPSLAVMPSIKNLQLPILPKKEGDLLYSPRSQSIVEALKLDRPNDNVQCITKGEVQKILTSIETYFLDWTCPSEPASEYRQLALQYFYTQLALFSQNSSETVYIPSSIYALTREILTRPENPFAKIEVNGKKLKGGHGAITLLEIGALQIAVKEVSDNSLQREIKAYSTLSPEQQRGVIPFYGIANKKENGEPKELIMEYAPGGNWKEKHENMEPCNYGLLREDLKSCLTSLSNFHSNSRKEISPSIHADIKPENIFIDKAGKSTLGDLGSAAKDDGEIRGYQTTVQFYSIDMLDYKKPLTVKSDIWQLGLSLYRILTKRDLLTDIGLSPKNCPGDFTLFLAGQLSNQEEKEKHQTEIEEKINSLNLGKANQDLIEILNHTLQIDPNKRFSAKELLEIIT